MMNDSSSALGLPTVSSRLQTFAASQLTHDRGGKEVLHADVVLAGPNSQPLDQRAWQLRGQWVDWFVSLDTRAWHTPRIRPPAEGWSNRTSRVDTRCTGLLVCRHPDDSTSDGTVIGPEVAMLQTAPIQPAMSDLEQRGPGARTIGVGLVAAVLLTVVFADRAEVLMMPVLAMVAVIAAVIDARTLRIPNWLTGTGGFLFAVLAVHFSYLRDGSWQAVVAGAAIMGGPLLAAHLVSKSRTPGLGDVKLAAVLGAPLGAVSPVAAYWALLLALILGAGFGLIFQGATQRRVFPLGPAISLASLVTAFAFGLADSNGVWTL